MAQQHSQSEHDGVQYIDPRLLEYTSGGVSAFQYNESADRKGYDELANELDDAPSAIPHEYNDVYNITSAAGHRAYFHPNHNNLAFLARDDSKQSLLNPGAQEFIPGRESWPRLTLDTELQELAHQAQTRKTPTTPQIKVQPPEDVNHKTSGHVRKTSHSRGRRRRQSSPGRRPSQSLVRRSTNEYRVRPPNYGSGSGLLSPSTVARWINEDPYHPGVPTLSMRFPNGTVMPAILPLTYHAAHSPSRSIQTTGPYYCEWEGCKKHDKPWDTQSELRKHQRVHTPKDQRPHACSECDEAFWYPKDLLRHSRAKHESPTPVKCPFCSKHLSRGDNLDRHIERQHGTATTAESSIASPTSPSLSSFSDLNSDTSPSTPMTSPWSPLQAFHRSFKGRPLLPAISDDPFIDKDVPGPASVAMTRGHTN